MTPTERAAALAKYLEMHPSPEREALREAIEACDAHDATAQRHEETRQQLARAQEVHDATGQRLTELGPAAAEGEAHVRELLGQAEAS
jgi:hypothetical protein